MDRDLLTGVHALVILGLPQLEALNVGSRRMFNAKFIAEACTDVLVYPLIVFIDLLSFKTNREWLLDLPPKFDANGCWRAVPLDHRIHNLAQLCEGGLDNWIADISSV